MHTKRPVARAHTLPWKLSSRLQRRAFAPSSTKLQALNKCESRSIESVTLLRLRETDENPGESAAGGCCCKAG